MINNTFHWSSSVSNGTSPDQLFVRYLVLIYSPIFILIGVPGNAISMVIWSRRVRTSPGSTCMLLAVMCATDTYITIHGCLRNWIKTFVVQLSTSPVHYFDIRVKLFCSGPLFVFTFLSDFSVWLIILLSIERTLSTWFPVKAKELCRLRNGAISLAGVVMFLVLANIHFFWTIRPNYPMNGAEPHCDYIDGLSPFLEAHWSIIDFVIYSFFPLTVVLVLNFLILFRVQQSSKRSSLSGRNSASSRHRSAKILRTVVCMTISHFVFTMPIVIYFMSGEEKCLANEAACEITLAICIMLQMANHLTHFFIYSITSSLFMRDLVHMFPGLHYFTRSAFRTELRRRTRVAEEFGIHLTHGILLAAANANQEAEDEKGLPCQQPLQKD